MISLTFKHHLTDNHQYIPELPYYSDNSTVTEFLTNHASGVIQAITASGYSISHIDIHSDKVFPDITFIEFYLRDKAVDYSDIARTIILFSDYLTGKAVWISDITSGGGTHQVITDNNLYTNLDNGNISNAISDCIHCYNRDIVKRVKVSTDTDTLFLDIQLH